MDEILRICRAFRHSDLTGTVTPPTWQKKGDDTVPTDFKKMIAWYQAKFGSNKIVKVCLFSQDKCKKKGFIDYFVHPMTISIKLSLRK